MSVEYKRAKLSEPPDETGRLLCVVSSLDVIDRDGDVLRKEAWEASDNKDTMMVWAHDWRSPVGRGTIRLDPPRVLFDGCFWMDTFDGEQAYKRVRNAGPLQEFSYGFEVRKSERTTVDGKPARAILDLELFEVSPVLVGASIGTGVLDLKRLTTAELKGPIPPHRTATASEDTAWDGPEQLRLAQSAADYRRISAYVDSDGDPDLRQSYKLPHHRMSDGAAVWRGVAAAMGALMGGRGGVQIPESARRGVYSHLAGHYRQDWDPNGPKEPPDFRSLEAWGALPQLAADLKAGRILSARSRAHVEAVLRELQALLAHADGRGSGDDDDDDDDDEAAKAATASGVTRLSTAEVVELLALRARSLGVNVAPTGQSAG